MRILKTSELYFEDPYHLHKYSFAQKRSVARMIKDSNANFFTFHNENYGIYETAENKLDAIRALREM